MASRRHVFISHHHADDKAVTSLTKMLSRKGYEIRNSSIRAKPANRERLKKGLVADSTIKRLLRMKMSWASTAIVVIGKNTANRPWVDWEINQAKRQGKRIIGVYERGGTENDKPAALEQYGSAIVNWNAESIISAVEGANTFQTPEGDDRQPVHSASTSKC
tara:strand:- start:59 stop:544 length:486 start_codon:yes stop_codon:yes gene_type:complete